MDTEDEYSKLIESYIRNCEMNTEEDFWAVKELNKMIWNAPDKAWQAILAMIDQVSSEDTLISIGSGVLEDLLVSYPRFLDEVEKEVAKSDKFRKALACVWRQNMPLRSWMRLQKIRRQNGIKMI